MTESRRSRRTWPGPMSVAGVEPGHEHDLPPALLARVRVLTRSLVIFGVCLAAIGTCLVLILLDRSNARDDQNERTNQRINDSICDLLDQLPEGGLLDRPRGKYHCGPGFPLSRLTPDERTQIRRPVSPPAASTPAPSAAPVPAPPLGSAATPGAAPRAPATLPPRTGPGPGGPTPTPPSPSPPFPVTGLVCDLAGVCI